MDYTELFYQQYQIEGNVTDQVLVVCRPVTKGGYFGDILSLDQTELVGARFPIIDDQDSVDFAKPVSYNLLFDFRTVQTAKHYKIYRPVAPEGYVALGCVVAESLQQIPTNIYCLAAHLATQTNNEKIEVYNPQTVPLSLIRNQCYFFDVDRKPYLPRDIPVGEQFEDSLSFVEPLPQGPDNVVNDGNGVAVRNLPVMDVNMQLTRRAAEIDPDANDTMTNLKIVQQPQQLADFLVTAANPLRLVVTPETSVEYVQQAVGFQLVGVTSLTKPTVDSRVMISVSEDGVVEELGDQRHEDYLYVYQPIAPPGYVALGVTTSIDEGVSAEVYCVSERCVQYTDKIGMELGRVYDQETASFIQDYMQIIDLPIQEKNARLRGVAAPKLGTVRLVIPQQSPFINLEAERYPVLRPEFVMKCFSGITACQKSILRTLKCEPENEYACSPLNLPGCTLCIHRQRLQKDTYNHLQYYCRCTPRREGVDVIQEQIAAVQAELAAIQGVQAMPERERKSPARSARQKPPTKEECPPEAPEPQAVPLPLECQLIDHNFGFDSFAVSQPVGYRKILSIRQGNGKLLHFIRLIPPEGFCAISDVTFEGDDIAAFDLCRHLCINKLYCQQLLLVPRAPISGCHYLMGFALPLGTDTLMESGYQALHVRNVTDYADFTGWQLRDQVIQAVFLQEKRDGGIKYSHIKQFSELEVCVAVRNVLELAFCDEVQVADGFEAANLDLEREKAYAAFGTILVEKLHDINDEALQAASRSASPTARLDTSKFIQKVALVDQFSTPYSRNAMFAHPVGAVRLAGSLDGGGRAVNCFKLVPPAGYVALCDVLSECDDISGRLGSYVCIHQQFVEYVTVEDPTWLVNGYCDSQNIWLYKGAHSNTELIVFDSYTPSFSVPVLKYTVATLVQSGSSQRGYYPNDENRYLADPRPMIQYLYNYCSNNKTTIHKQKLNDLECHLFDGKLVVDPFLQQNNCMMVSVGSLRVYSTQQTISESMATTALQQIKSRELKQQEIKFTQVSEKINLLEHLIQVFRSLGRFRKIIQYGRNNYYTLERTNYGYLNKNTNTLLVSRENLSTSVRNSLLSFRIPINSYMVVSDKIPLNSKGGIFLNKPIYYHLVVKCLAKTVGDYTTIFRMGMEDIIRAFVGLFGYELDGEIAIFSMYYNQKGDLRMVPEDAEESQSQDGNEGWKEVTVYIA